MHVWVRYFIARKGFYEIYKCFGEGGSNNSNFEKQAFKKSTKFAGDMKITPELEEAIKAKAVEHLAHGRPGWDVPHTLTAVYWMKELIKEEGGDEGILVPTMYLHDLGYAGLFREIYELEGVLLQKEKHMIISAIEARKILDELRCSYRITQPEIVQIVGLVRKHDRLEELKTYEEILVLEADALAQIDVGRVKPTYTKDHYCRFLDNFWRERVPRFRTDTGRSVLGVLLEKVGEYWEGRD